MDRRAVRAEGAGLAGCPGSWRALAGVRWSYRWWWQAPDWWCIPMLRSNMDPARLSFRQMMENKEAVLLLNEPENQEGCGLECQVRFLHDSIGKILHWNGRAQVIWWNGAYPSAEWIERQLETWADLYPGKPFPKVDVGVHLYDKTAGVAVRFQEKVRALMPGSRLVVTECGSLENAANHRRMICCEVPVLLAEGIPTAVFLWGRDEGYKHCSLGADGEGLTAMGKLYEAVIEMSGGVADG